MPKENNIQLDVSYKYLFSSVFNILLKLTKKALRNSPF
ncbi:hypothetical protein bthur0011_27620 [Bacillus thuringiensis serovar huazhongensis BGSC 4BD1]|nr:hypothetical protein bthur0011_27620 [Bacillus thuringiensis serovar huazhongensis BGSC 4BD1]